MSEAREKFIDLIHLAGMAMSSGRHMPSELFLDRQSYNKWCIQQEKKRTKWIKREMKRQELIEIKEKGNMVVLNITDKGRLEITKQRILKENSKLLGGDSCLVSFDIPEVACNSRKAFRNFLKQAGFQQVHKSVWQSDRNVVQPLRELIQQLGIEEWVKVFQVIE